MGIRNVGKRRRRDRGHMCVHSSLLGGQTWDEAMVNNIWRLRDTRGDKVEGRLHFLQCVYYSRLLQSSEGQKTHPHRSLSTGTAGLLTCDQELTKFKS